MKIVAFARATRGRLTLLAAALAAVLAVGTLTVANSSARSNTKAAAHDKTHKKHGKQHRQALKGPVKKSKVKVVKVIIRGGKGSAIAAGDDYPAKWRDAPMDSELDQWREYNRECTSFVAWALYSRNGFNMPFYDNANEWGPDAQKRGYLVNHTPVPGSVAWSNAGEYGHVAYVVGVSGSSVTVEEYNEHYTGTYDQRTVPASTFTGYIHFKDPTVTIANPSPTTTTTQTVTSTVSTTTTTGTTTGSDGTPTVTTGTTIASAPVAAPTWSETAGSVAHTWTNYANAGGSEGPSIASGQAVQIACKVTGFAVADGNSWWYRIASSPWNSQYYVSADAFYNDGRTSGSLIGTPFVDPAVANC